ncbi:class II aldolase/adducin family protein [Rhodosalinus sp. FB01]|uniref:class II aldolase/adducin family protein n=1 Tax=Rhodosalinus sp. FB01 TaxID=3239194 RepID=UPI003526B576
MDHNDLRQKMIDAGRVLFANGQDDFTRGHISVRLPEDPSLFLMKPHSIGLDELTPKNILTVDLNGNVVAGTARRHSEVFIHTEIFKAREDVISILHTHPTYCVALSATRTPLLPVSQPGALFHQSVGYYEDTINLIRSAEMGAGIARALNGNRAVLLKHHGIVCTGASIEETVIGAIMLENAAQTQMIAQAAGELSDCFPDEDIAILRQNISKPEQFTINFDYLVRRLGR